MNDLVYKLPACIKIHLGEMQTILHHEKREAINQVNHYNASDFANLNSLKYKENLKKFFASSAWSAEEIQSFAKWLYTDKINLINQGVISADSPYIIAVVKNEADKLVHFFDQYKRLGSFNYIFIDNGSSDSTIDLIIQNNGTVYQCLEQFSTNRKLSWINKVYSTIPNGPCAIRNSRINFINP